MSAWLKTSFRSKQFPILLLLAVNLIAGLMIFRDFGLAWDEPLGYGYADAVGYAYSPREWFGGDFDLEKSYGPSAEDHKTRGPAYYLLTRQFVYLLEFAGLDMASAWHLVNFISFQIGIFIFYLLCLRWMKAWPAFFAAALFSTQPLIWGHSFINPKDATFIVFLTASVLIGFHAVDSIETSGGKTRWKVLFAGIVLGLSTSVRILAPIGGLMVVSYAAVKYGRKVLSKKFFLLGSIYFLAAAVAMVLTWPYLWPDPINRFIGVVFLMAEHPGTIQVLFGGAVYPPFDLPRRYLPTLLLLTLTEPVWPLFIIGLGLSLRKTIRSSADWKSLAVIAFFWLWVPIFYIILWRPPLADNFRHFLFITAPVFIFSGLTFEFFSERIKFGWLNAVLALALLAPGPLGIAQLHPYEYTYYNLYIGGPGGAFRKFETDYWLTCYKEAVENFNPVVERPASLYVHREAYIAARYAAEGITVLDERGARAQIHTGDYLLVNTRINEDEKTFPDAPVIQDVGRAGAIFCVIKRIP